MADPYQILGVARSADDATIKRAYRRLAKKLHPDLNPGDKAVENRFKEATAAYELLSDAEKRRQFDLGLIDELGNPRMQAQDFAGAPRGGMEEDELFRDFFGNFGAGRRFRMRGADVTYRLEIGFLDAAKGARKRLKLADKTIDVTIPPGMEDGQTLRLKGQGMPGQGGAESGDAYIEAAIQPHPYFERDGRDVRLELPISLQEAALGATVSTPTIDGPVALKVPKASSSGDVLRLAGRGIPGADGGRGDQLVRLQIKLPERLDPALEKAIAEAGRTSSFDPRARFKAS